MSELILNISADLAAALESARSKLKAPMVPTHDLIVEILGRISAKAPAAMERIRQKPIEGVELSARIEETNCQLGDAVESLLGVEGEIDRIINAGQMN